MCAGTEEGGFVVGDVVCVGWEDDTKVSYDKSVTIITIKQKLTSRQSNIALLVLIGHGHEWIGMCAATEEGGVIVGEVVCVGWDADTKVSYDKSVTSITINN